MNTEALKENLNSESGYLNWVDIEIHFAKGIVRVIASDLNFIEVTTDVAQNNSEKISVALANKTLYLPTDSEAKQWHQDNSKFLCIVLAPFVLIQKCV